MPTEADVQRAIELLTSPANYEYFFEQLHDLEWITPLKQAGFFSIPPKPEKTEHGVRYLVWPESRFLARVADQDPELVLKTIQDVADTENFRVHDDFIEAAIKMPGEQAESIADEIGDWLSFERHPLFGFRLNRLIKHLLAEGKTKAAFRLALRVLGLRPPTPEPDERRGMRFREPQAKVDPYDYAEILSSAVTELMAIDGIKTLCLLVDLLRAAVSVKSTGEDASNRDGISGVWYPDVGTDLGESNYDISERLVQATRNTAQHIAEGSHDEALRVVNLLEDQETPIFWRIALHILRVSPNLGSEDAVSRTLNSKYLNSLSCQNEYRLLVREYFADLEAHYPSRWLDLIISGPDRDGDIDPTEVRSWQRARLSAVVDMLPSDWRQHNSELLEGLEIPEDFAIFRVKGFWGVQSPKEGSEIRTVNIPQLISYLGSWEPDRGILGPEKEGLANVVTSEVEFAPKRFAESATEFADVEHIYLRGVLRGFANAVRERRRFPWEPVLNLCLSVVTREVPDSEDALKEAHWTRSAVSDLLWEILNLDPAELPIELKELFWTTLNPLTHDADPSGVDSETEMDPATHSINCVRGRALHTVSRYVWWVWKMHGGGEDDESKAALSLTPEARVVLEEHLQIESDSSLAIRSVYGRWIPMFLHIDPVWARQALPDVFPSDQELARHRLAAWESVILFWRPSYTLLNELYDEYKWALCRLSDSNEESGQYLSPDTHLADHVITYYWHGRIGLGDGDLVEILFRNGSEEVLTDAVEFVARSLRMAEERPDAETLVRLMKLGEWRLARIEKEEVPQHAGELSSYRSWISGRWLDPRWALSFTIRTIKMLGTELKATRDDKDVVAAMSELVYEFPSETLQILRALVGATDAGWDIQYWRGEAKTLLRNALTVDDPMIRQRTDDLINRLVAMGHREFREIKHPSASEPGDVIVGSD